MTRTRLPTNAFAYGLLNHLEFRGLNWTTYQADNQTYEDDEFYVKVHWFPANEYYPDGHHMRPAMVEVYARLKATGEKGFVYRNGTGNDVHPEFGATGWRFHMV